MLDLGLLNTPLARESRLLFPQEWLIYPKSQCCMNSQQKKILDFSILHCVSGYPVEPKEYSLQNIADMSERFNCPIGLSDHTLSNVTAAVGIAMGASIVEKHLQ